jgi:response regulator RpfG family c-di-GMP phosphodiesterase
MLFLRKCENQDELKQVTFAALKLARKVGVPEEKVAAIRIGALLHDVGKLAIPDEILFKTDKLDEPEWEIMHRHPQYARELLAPMPHFRHVLEIPYCHHESWDGSGYPNGLAGTKIPLAARIFTIADFWNSLSFPRPYRVAWQEDAIRFYLQEQAGISLDPTLVPLFIEMQYGARTSQNTND